MPKPATCSRAVILLFALLFGIDLTAQTARESAPAQGQTGAAAVEEPPLPTDPFSEPIPFVPPLIEGPAPGVEDDPLRLRPQAPVAAPDLTLPGDVPQEAPTGRLAELAGKVAPSVVALKSWDASGELLATTVGCLISADGLILTDMEIIHPIFADRIDSITAAAGDGIVYRIEGLWNRDARSGVTLLKATAEGAPFLAVAEGVRAEQELPVHVLAFREERGLSLADATVRADTTLAGEGWLNVRGKDSPGSPGSPVIDDAGRVVAMVALRAAEVQWMNFAVPVEVVAALRGEKIAAVTPLDRLPSGGFAKPVDDPAFIEAFKRLYEGRQVRASAPEWLRLARRYPRSAEVWAVLGLVCDRLGAREEALACAAKAAALDPAAGPYWSQLGVLSLRGGGADSAQGAAERLVGAGEYFEKAARQSPGDRFAWFLLGQSRLARGEAGAAAEALQQAVKLDADFGEAFFLLGYALAKTGDLTAAGTAVRESTRLRPADARSWYYLALLQRKEGRPREATRSMERVTRIEPGHPRAWLALAHLYREVGDDANARLAFVRHNRLPAAPAPSAPPPAKAASGSAASGSAAATPRP